jgi:hypothetical protein
LSKKISRSAKSKNSIDLKTSTINQTFNILIVLLVTLIIYLCYSIFIKFGNSGSDLIELRKNSVASEIIQVEVLNGCGVNGLADRFTDYLRLNDFDVVSTGNYESFDILHTLVIDRTGNIANAKKVAEAIGIKKENVIQQLNNDYLLDVSIIVGKDFHKLKPIKTGN